MKEVTTVGVDPAKNIDKRLENHWPHNVLAHQIGSRLFERRGAKTGIDNLSERLPVPDSVLPREGQKDPSVFDFLSVGEEVGQSALEEALIAHLTRFMPELGKGFPLDRGQYHLHVSEQDQKKRSLACGSEQAGYAAQWSLGHG